MKTGIALLLVLLCVPLGAAAQDRLDDARLAALMDEAEAEVQNRAKFAQVMVDMIFSFSELEQLGITYPTIREKPAETTSSGQ